jgi:hypothetical protein
MAQYADLCRDQQRYLEKVDVLVNGQCANFGAFTGFMAMFAGAYQDAHATVADEIRRAAGGAGDMGSAVEAVLADFRRTDDGVDNDLGKLSVKVGCATFDGIAGHEGGPGVPGQIKTTNAGVGVLAHAGDMADDLPQHLSDGLPGRTPPLPDADLRGLPTDGVEFVSQVTDTAAAGISIGQAQDDEDTYEEFEGRRGSREESGE